MARLDPHSYADDQQPQVKTLDWSFRVDFAARVLTARATLTLDRDSGGALDLDTRALKIHSVKDAGGAALRFTLHREEPILGSRLSIELPVGSRVVQIEYQTSPDASALQWLEPSQTSTPHPFLFSQCQAIHARAVVPIQDTPRVRITYRAEVTAPAALKVLMAAGFISRTEQGLEAIERYEMPQPIPPYLIAFAIGQLESRDLSARTRVWAEPSVVERCAYEFVDVEKMIVAAEALFGPYPWERFDILTLPRSFPYGGMENPRLTFVTPTLLAGDRSLVSVIAHELAHSWTGNLVTNANAEHFWLNEGWTVFAERRINEALEGTEMATLHSAIGLRALERAFEQHKKHPELTRLRTQLKNVDPDEAFSTVPYEKGFLFLRTLEEAVGRERFDAFARAYLKQHAFGTITTEEFSRFVEAQLPGALLRINARAWFEEPGLPANAPLPHSKRLEAISSIGANPPAEALARSWTPIEWQLYLEALPRSTQRALCEQLDRAFKLNASTNHEVLVSWLVVASRAGYPPALDRIRDVLSTVGRMKYLRPLYQALADSPSTKAEARPIFERNKGGYHPIARQVVDALLKERGV